MAPGSAWHRLIAAEAVRPGEIVDAAVGELDLVVWSGHDGVLCVMEARCPHQWSHLGAEGVVDGDEIVCCAHGWRFCRDGSGWKENLAGRRDRKADIEVFPAEERDGTLWAQLPPAR